MPIYLFFSIPLAVIWMGITGQISLENFILGILLSYAVLRLTDSPIKTMDIRQLPSQSLAFAIYITVLMRDIFLSGVTVARVVLSPQMPIHMGIVAVDTQDENKDPTICALSAIVITLTPGELVVDIKDNHIMYVHSLDYRATLNNCDNVQGRRLNLLRRLLGVNS